MQTPDKLCTKFVLSLLLLTTAEQTGWADAASERQPAPPLADQETGRWKTVTGRFVWPKGVTPLDLSHSYCMFSLHLDEAAEQEILAETLRKEKIMPEGFSDWDAAKKVAFASTEAGREAFAAWGKASNKYRDQVRQPRPVELDSDGSFSIESIKPGVYELYLLASATEGDQRDQLKGRRIAKYSAKNLVVPPLQSGSDVTKFSLGELEVTPNRTRLEVGDIAYHFEAPLLGDSAKDPFPGNKKVSLSDLRGKLVLLEFSEAGCLGCHQIAPALEAVWERFHKDNRFTMLGLFGDAEPQYAIEGFINKHSIAWPCVYLGPKDTSSIFNDYGVNGIPDIWLIGPDGKVLARDLREGKTIMQAVEKALDQMPAHSVENDSKSL